MQSIETDFLIVGQGIAGTLLHFCLKKRGEKVHIIDRNHFEASSKAAAGGINPVTGKRFVKSWKIDQLLPTAKQMYQELETDLEIPIFTERNVFRILKNAGEENTWLSRSADPNYAKYFVEPPSIGAFEKHLHPFPSAGEIKNGAQVNMPELISTYRKKLLTLQELTTEKFDYKLITFDDKKVRYKNITARYIVFCEGAAVVENPYFKYLPFQPSKGEALVIKLEKPNCDKIIRHKISLVPIGENTYWTGSTNNWELLDSTPTPAAKKELIGHLNNLLKSSFEIKEHRAAIRPTVLDRRPTIGVHHAHHNLLIFNGFGTKGASLAPWFAEHFCNWILDEQKLDPIININRFSNKKN